MTVRDPAERFPEHSSLKRMKLAQLAKGPDVGEFVGELSSVSGRQPLKLRGTK